MRGGVMPDAGAEVNARAGPAGGGQFNSQMRTPTLGRSHIVTR